MPALNITGSLNVASLDSNIVCDLCAGKFFIDATPSVFIGSGANNILGIKVKIVNPYNVIVKDYTNAYDIPSPASAVYQFNLPTQAGNYQYGQYLVSIKLVDADGTEYEVTKPVSPCEPDKNNKTKKFGIISASIEGICSEAKARIRINNVPVYKGTIAVSQLNNFKVEYPTGSELDPIPNITTTVFSLKLFEGQYRVSGSVCAKYEAGDNASYKVSYLLDKTKDLRCTIDECCIFEKLTEIHQRINSQCTLKEKEEIASITLDVLRLLKTAKLAAACGSDASDYVIELEQLLQCRCSATNESTPLSDTNPSKDFSIIGCNVQKETVGLTDTYTIENYEYIVEANISNGGVITVSAPQLTECKKTQIITFDIQRAYLLIKQAANSNIGEANAWASIVNKMLTGITATSLGVTQLQWDAMTLEQRITAIINKVGSCCGCSSDININTEERVGSDVKITFHTVGVVGQIRIYLDGVLQDILLGSVSQYTFNGAADGQDHEYLLQPICENGSIGTSAMAQFNEAGCPDILPISVTSNNVNSACPFDLTSLVTPPPVGITAEWHTTNNTGSSSLVGNPANVSGGSYYVFAKNADGCYSTGVNVLVVCIVADSCSAPQNPSIYTPTGGLAVKAVFNSAAYPPPANSYTVKRRLFTDPDVSGSYTVLGIPTWDAIKSRWQVNETIPAYNTRFLWRYISNCASTTPSVDYTYVRWQCPTINVTPTSDSIPFSFNDVGGEIDKYVIQLWNSTGTALLQTKTYLPAFAPTISDAFSGLSANTLYKIRTIIYIGGLNNICADTNTSTTDVSELPCVDILLTLSFIPAGANDLWAIQVDLDQDYNEDITVEGFISNGVGSTIPFSITVPAHALGMGSGNVFSFPSSTEGISATIESVFPIAAHHGGTEYSTQCEIGLATLYVAP